MRRGFGLVFLLLAVLAIAALVLWIWALVDCVQVPDDSMYQSGNKLVWVLIIVFLSWIGALLYLAIGRPSAPSRAGAATQRPAARPSPPPPAGPSDPAARRPMPPIPPPPD